MTARTPLVLGGDGLHQQLQSGDTLAGLGGRVFKTADESRFSTTTLAADGALVQTLGVGTWVVRIVCFFDNSSSATAGFKFDVNFAGTGTWGTRRHKIFASGATGGTSGEQQFVGTGTIGSTSVAAASASVGYVEFEGVITVTVSGAVQFRWSQNTSSSSVAIVSKGSYLEYVQIA